MYGEESWKAALERIEHYLLHAVSPEAEKYDRIPYSHVHIRMRLIVNVWYEWTNDSYCALEVQEWIRYCAPFQTQQAEEKWQDCKTDKGPPSVLFDRIKHFFVVMVHARLESMWFVVSTLLQLSKPWSFLRKDLDKPHQSEAREREDGSCH